MTIILYDIPSTLPGNAWSPNTWKVRYHIRAVLNYKGIPYRTEWVEYPDIAPLSKELGINPTSMKEDGSPAYTLPAIYDPSTSTYVSDSLLIAKYLEKTYPDTPPVFPNNTIGFQKAFTSFIQSIAAARTFIVPITCPKLNPRSQEYFRRTREIFYGKKLEDVVPTGDAWTEEWGKVEKGLDTVYSTYLVPTDEKGPYVMGDTISWSDFVLFSYLYLYRLVLGEDSKEWKDIASWNGGRWEAHLNILKKYTTVV